MKAPLCTLWGPDIYQAKHEQADHSGEQGYRYKDILGCFYRHEASRSRELLVIFIWHLLDHIWKITSHFGPPEYEKEVHKLQGVLLRAIRMVRGWEHMPCEERLRELCSVRRPEGKPRASFQNLRLLRKWSKTLYVGAWQQDERQQSYGQILI